MKKIFFALFFLGISPLICEECGAFPSFRSELKHREERGIGYEKGYSTIAILGFPFFKQGLQPLLNARFHVFNDGRFASNVGFGLRTPSYSEKWVFGINLYWDFRESKRLTVNQFGAGLEALGNLFDVRINGTIPFGNNDHFGSLKFAGFQDSRVIYKQRITAALPTIFFEIGGMLYRPINLYFAVSPYYLFRNTVNGFTLGDEAGILGRLSALVYDGIKLGIEASYDRIFHGTVQGFISFSFPFGPGNLRKGGRRWKENYTGCMPKAKLNRKLTEPIDRSEIIPIEQTTVRFTLQPFNQI